MICDGCIHSQVCKYKTKVTKYESQKREELPEPLEDGVGCKYRRTEPSQYMTLTGSSYFVCDGSTNADYCTV